jgi:hypothetical protein
VAIQSVDVQFYYKCTTDGRTLRPITTMELHNEFLVLLISVRAHARYGLTRDSDTDLVRTINTSAVLREK